MDCDEISKKWLDNIKKLDDKNQLRHGEFYASDGSVHDLEIDNNIVTAKVDGAPGYVYDVKIVFKKCSSQDIKFLERIISLDPVIYSKLLNNEIPDELFTTKVKILFDSIKDFKMSCSCNKGLFCKHKAAVFHKLAQQISKNPFLVFTLRGFDIYSLIQDDSHKIKNIRDILKNDVNIHFVESSDDNYLEKIFFTLSDYPSFYPSYINFNEILYDTLKDMPKCVNRILNPINYDVFNEYIVLGNVLNPFSFYDSKDPDRVKIAFQDKWGGPQDWDEFKIDLNGIYNIIKINTNSFDNYFVREELKLPFFAFFAELSQFLDVSEYCEDIKFLHELFLFTANLISLNAFVPEIFRLDNKEYHIRWIPYFDEKIYKSIDLFVKRCPDDLLTFYESSIPKKNQVINIISLFFEGFSQYYINQHLDYSLDSFVNDPYFRLFFIKSQDFSSYIFKGKEIEIEKWLSSLFLSQNDYKMIINSKQSDGTFNLDLEIEIDGKEYDFEEIVKLRRIDIIKNLIIIQNIFKKFYMDYDFSMVKGMDLSDFSYFLDEIAPALRVCGVVVNVPDEFVNVKSAKLLLDVKTQKPKSSLALDDLVDFDWKIAIGDENVSVDDFETFTTNFRGLIKIKNKYYMVDENNLEELRLAIENIPKNLNQSNILSYLLSSSSDNIVLDSRITDLIDDIFEIPEIDVPSSLNGELRPYQENGYSWLVQNMEVGFGSILADDMGLGKTIQVLALILYLKENNKLNDSKVLIVAPTSILTNWAMEIEKFAPSLKVEIYHGVNRHYPDDECDILLTSFGILRSDVDDLNDFNWKLFVVDEAQNIKNPDSKQTKAVKKLKADHHIALSGTPIENNLGEYWSIFDFTNKGYLSTLSKFKDRFLKPIQNDHDAKVLSDFKKITSPFILRRLKTDKTIIKELPDKMVNDIYCNLSVKQAAMYDEALEVLLNEVSLSEGIQRRGLVLKLINALKQICNHPAHYLNSEDAKINESGKMEVLMNLLETILAADEKILIFTQYVKMGHIIKKLIEDKFSQDVLFLHGGVSRQNRDKMIREFQEGESKIFILSLKAGGIGLNLTAATNVVHYDLWWNPAVENQATDRAYRIGQTENVMVYRFITRGTLEESINQILLEKRELVDMAIGDGESFITEMSNEELRNLLDLRQN